MICTIHQGQVSKDQLLPLEASLKATYAAQFGGAVTVLWCELPHGQGYTEGHLSDVSLVMVEVKDGLDQAKRETAMMALATDWARLANVGIDKLMITLADRALFRSYLKANSSRIRRSRRPWFFITTLVHLWRSRRRDGYLALRANL
jgi:hypothetical protein